MDSGVGGVMRIIKGVGRRLVVGMLLVPLGMFVVSMSFWGPIWWLVTGSVNPRAVDWVFDLGEKIWEWGNRR